jgi:hypothetical protein
MSIDRLQLAVQSLPYNLREQVLGYARSVDAAAPDIAREARIDLSPLIRDQLVFLAGLRKFYAICASSYWAVDNASAFLQLQDVGAIRVGRTDYSRGGELHTGLRVMLRDFDIILRQYDLVGIADVSYTELLSRLANEY